jgi:hypothetical protein
MVPKILSCFSFSKSIVNGADAGIKGLIRDVKSNLIRLSGTHVVGFEFRSLQARKLLYDLTNFELSGFFIYFWIFLIQKNAICLYRPAFFNHETELLT